MDRALRTRIEDPLRKLVNEQLKNNVFSACSVGFVDGSGEEYRKEFFYYGNTDSAGGIKVDEKTLFDLASLTKPLVTSLSVLTLQKMGLLSLTDPVADYLQHSGKEFEEVQIIHLLEHTAALPAHREFFRTLNAVPEKKRTEKVEELIGLEARGERVGAEELYSDLGYILLGIIVEKLCGKPLNQFWEEEIATPLALKNQLYFNENQTEGTKVYATTGVCQWSNLPLSGLVNDDNCRSLGGVAGHAGLFGTVSGLVDMVTTLLQLYENSYGEAPFSLEPVRKKLKEDHGRWVLGFDTPTGEFSSSGSYFSSETLGHLGFTGTSFWMDCAKKIGIVVLTNRVLCGDDLTGVQRFRPKVHDLIMEKLMD